MVVDDSFTLRFEDLSSTKLEPLDEKKVLIDGATQTEVFEDELKNENENLKRILAKEQENKNKALRQRLLCAKRMRVVLERIQNENKDLKRRMKIIHKLARNQEPKYSTFCSNLQESMTKMTTEADPESSPLSKVSKGGKKATPDEFQCNKIISDVSYLKSSPSPAVSKRHSKLKVKVQTEIAAILDIVEMDSSMEEPVEDDSEEVFPIIGPYECEICQMITNTKAEFVAHIKAKHRDRVDEEVLNALEADIRKSSKKKQKATPAPPPPKKASPKKTPGPTRGVIVITPLGPTSKKATPKGKPASEKATKVAEVNAARDERCESRKAKIAEEEVDQPQTQKDNELCTPPHEDHDDKIVGGKRLASQLQRLKNNGVSVTMTNVAVGPRKRKCKANPLSSENKISAKKSNIEVITL